MIKIVHLDFKLCSITAVHLLWLFSLLLLAWFRDIYYECKVSDPSEWNLHSVYMRKENKLIVIVIALLIICTNTDSTYRLVSDYFEDVISFSCVQYLLLGLLGRLCVQDIKSSDLYVIYMSIDINFPSRENILSLF